MAAVALSLGACGGGSAAKATGGDSGSAADTGPGIDATPDDAEGIGLDATIEAGANDAETAPDVVSALASSFICGHWADPRDNFVPDNLVLSGLSATDTHSSLRAKSE